jgi:RNA polymerase sigma-70 factor (ECF subfamily)
MIEQQAGLLAEQTSDQAIARGNLLRSAVALAATGDQAAFESLVTVLQRMVHRWALTFARDPDEADEIVQETFVLVHNKLRQYRGDSPVEGWVYRIARRVALQRHRKDRRRRQLSEAAFLDIEDVYTTDPGARVDRQKMAEYIRHFFTTLPPRQREVFDLIDLQGNEPAAVARLLGTSAGAVRANLFKARASIRERLLAEHPAWQEVQS